MNRASLLFLPAVLLAGRDAVAQGDAVAVDPATRWAVVRQLGEEAKKNKKLIKMLDKTVSAQVAKARATLVEPDEVERAVAQIDAEVVRPGHLVEVADGVKAAHVLLVSIEAVGGEVAVTLHRYEVDADLRVTFEKVVKANAAARTLKKGIVELMAVKKRRKKAKAQPATASAGRGSRVFGAAVSVVQPKTAKELTLKKTRGALVGEVHAEGLAARIGLRVGDVVLKYGKRPIKAAPDLHAAIVEAGLGEVVPIEAWRDGAKVELQPPQPQAAVAGGKTESPEGDTAQASGNDAGGAAAGAEASDATARDGTAAGSAAGARETPAVEDASSGASEGATPSAASEPAPSGAVAGAGNGAASTGAKTAAASSGGKPAAASAGRSGPPPEKEVQRRKLGVRVKTVTDSRAKEIGLPYATGALVIAVEKGGAGADAGVRANDVILSIGDSTVSAARELSKVVAASLAYRPIPMEVWRDRQSVLLEVFFGVPKAKEGE